MFPFISIVDILIIFRRRCGRINRYLYYYILYVTQTDFKTEKYAVVLELIPTRLYVRLIHSNSMKI